MLGAQVVPCEASDGLSHGSAPCTHPAAGAGLGRRPQRVGAAHHHRDDGEGRQRRVLLLPSHELVPHGQQTRLARAGRVREQRADPLVGQRAALRARQVPLRPHGGDAALENRVVKHQQHAHQLMRLRHCKHGRLARGVAGRGRRERRRAAVGRGGCLTLADKVLRQQPLAKGVEGVECLHARRRPQSHEPLEHRGQRRRQPHHPPPAEERQGHFNVTTRQRVTGIDVLAGRHRGRGGLSSGRSQPRARRCQQLPLRIGRQRPGDGVTLSVEAERRHRVARVAPPDVQQAQPRRPAHIGGHAAARGELGDVADIRAVRRQLSSQLRLRLRRAQ
mmetsp:Transcript_17028/g.59658  ORF Transcript_17028/g.59658 Transcript_17028/m.59658 type:complete len:333 (-) Transcript_17028:861-1859(-)